MVETVQTVPVKSVGHLIKVLNRGPHTRLPRHQNLYSENKSDQSAQGGAILGSIHVKEGEILPSWRLCPLHGFEAGAGDMARQGGLGGWQLPFRQL
jgi:hypothetical protein